MRRRRWREHGVVSSNRTKIISKRRLSATLYGRSPTIAISVTFSSTLRVQLRDFFCPLVFPSVFRNEAMGQWFECTSLDRKINF